jgi:hypothetical protein
MSQWQMENVPVTQANPNIKKKTAAEDWMKQLEEWWNSKEKNL